MKVSVGPVMFEIPEKITEWGTSADPFHKMVTTFEVERDTETLLVKRTVVVKATLTSITCDVEFKK